jgi:hypothetical protein
MNDQLFHPVPFFKLNLGGQNTFRDFKASVKIGPAGPIFTPHPQFIELHLVTG